MFDKIKNFLKEEKGAETMEYIAIAAIIIVLGAAAYSAIGVSTVVQTGVTQITSAITNPGG
jgi:Flp pilus assembly pilin Flp